MKKAKVSSVYEGKRRRKSREEEDNSSKRARMNAKARKHGHKANAKAVDPFVTFGKRVATRSIIKIIEEEKGNDQQLYKAQEEKETNVEIIPDPTINNNVLSQPKLNNGVEAQPETKLKKGAVAEPESTGTEGVAQPLTFNATMAKPKEGLEWFEEWPLQMTYEEEWIWSGRWPNGRPHWEVMDFGFQVLDDDEQEPWWDDIWNLRDGNDVLKNP